MESGFEPVEIPINGVLDLHTFHPGDVPDLLSEYIRACRRKGILRLRIIHGKGMGVLKERVRSQLGKNPHVSSFHDAPAGSRGMGCHGGRSQEIKKAADGSATFLGFGGAEGDRTPDLMTASHALSQLSYSPS